MKIKRDKRDDLFSKLVRERANHTCEYCGKYCGPNHENGRLDCSHFYSRRIKSLRWCPDNAFAHCFTCHQRLGENPYDFAKWAEERLGKGLCEILREKSRQLVRLRKADLEALYQHLREQYKAMQEKRKDGEMGRIEFEGWL